MKLRLPVLTNGGIILSYKCTNKCKHCLYASSPAWDKWFDIDDLDKVFKSLSKFTFWGIHFAGGEPFLNFELLLQSVKLASKYNIPMEYVETNCYWCINEDEIREKLSLLKEAGLHSILISVSPFHNEFIPLIRVLKGYKLAVEILGRENVFLYVDYYLNLLKNFNINKRIKFSEFENFIGKKNVGDNIKYYYGLILNGRTVVELEKYFPHYPMERVLTDSCYNKLVNPHHIHIDLYGDYITGFCAGISMGKNFDVADLFNKGIELEKYPILNILINKGTRGLLEFVKENSEFTPLKNGYISECHLCNHLRWTLIKNNLRFEELSPIEYYYNLFK